jgi:hypothetical protein
MYVVVVAGGVVELSSEQPITPSATVPASRRDAIRFFIGGPVKWWLPETGL